MAEVPAAGFQLSADDSLQKDLRLRRSSLRQRELSLYDKFRGSISAFPKSSSKFSDHLEDDGTQLEQRQLEEIPTHGFVQAKLLDGLTVVQTESAIRALAQLHALSLKPMKQLKEEAVMPFTQISPQIEEAVKECLLEQLLDLPDSDEYFRQNEQALRTFWGKARFAAGVDVLGGKRAAEPVVLCHGNLSAENIWFPQLSAAEDEEKVEQLGKNDVQEEKTPLIVSWELARPGSGLSDLAHLLLSSINSQDLLQHLDSWLDLYLTTFEQHRQQLKKKEKKKGTTTKKMVAAVTLPRRKFGFSSGKSLAEQQRKRRKNLNAHLQTQLARVLPKLAFEYRKLLADHLVEDPEAFERHRCDLLSRMTGGFELVRKELEEHLF